MHVLHRSSLIYLWWNNYVIIRPFCHIIVVCFLWTWHSGSKLGWYRPDAGSHRADASVFLTHNAIHIQSGEGAYRRGNSLDDSRLWSVVGGSGAWRARMRRVDHQSNRTCLYRRQPEPWWRASIWRSHRKVVIKQCSYHNNIIDIQNRLPYSKVVYPAIIVLFSCLMEVNHGVRTGPDYPFR